MKKTPTYVALAAVAAGFAGTAAADTLAAKTQFGRNEIRLYAEPLAYEVLRDGVPVVPKTPIGIMLDGTCRKDAKFLGATERAVESTMQTPVYKKASVDLSARFARADFGDFAVSLAARADGVAWRFELNKAATVTAEGAAITVPEGARCWFNRNSLGNWGCEESMPEFTDMATLPNDPKKTYYLPFAYTTGGKTVVVTETDLHDYPIWNFKEVQQNASGARMLPEMERAPKATERVGGWGKSRGLKTGGRWVRVTSHEDFLVQATGPRTLPWRVFVLADSPAKLCEADIVYALATPAAEGSDFSWVKPGKVAWDWWNCFDNRRVPANGGCNTKTYERFIDFAAKSGVEYVIFDEGWSESLNIWKFHKDVDVPHLLEYAKQRNVGIILWMAWAQVYGDEEHVASHFAKLGVKGFKVDFMDRGDAEVATFLEKFASVCAKHRMLLDYHGAYRPVGLNRTYPNILNYEGIHGLEQMKWAPANKDMAMNDVACFFLRLTAGPMDYTPGAMNNLPYGKYTAGEGHRYPGSVGTRCHQMAMMALYEAYLQMLCDSPTSYEQNEECFRFMAGVPVTWNATVGLGGCPETMAAAARKAKDGSWYAAGLCTKKPRAYEIDTSFLGGGDWTAEIFRDAPDANEHPTHYIHETKNVKSGDKVPVPMSVGGGFIVKFSRR